MFNTCIIEVYSRKEGPKKTQNRSKKLYENTRKMIEAWNTLNKLCLAHNVCLMVSKITDMTQMIKKLMEVSLKYGLKINIQKNTTYD